MIETDHARSLRAATIMLVGLSVVQARDNDWVTVFHPDNLAALFIVSLGVYLLGRIGFFAYRRSAKKPC